MAAKRVQSRSWFGTLNNYNDAELIELRCFDCVYKAIGFHVGQKSKLPHLHCVVQFKNPRGFPKLSKRWHWESRKGDIKQAIDYLNKDNKLEEYGDRPPEKKDLADEWADFVSSIHKGQVDQDSMMFARYRSYTLHRLADLRPRKDYEGELRAKNVWIWGPPGVGKSRMVRQTFRPDQIYTKFLNKWWDNFKDERCVLIEDADPKQCSMLAHYFKVWSDRYSFGAEIKNGRIQINPCDFHLVVTSNYSIYQCFDELDIGPLLRRFDVIYLKALDLV